MWGCVDIDSYAGFDHKKLIDKIKQFKLPLAVCRSKSGGAHVFLFSELPVAAERMRDKLTEIKTLLGYGGSEVFPKQIQLKSADDTGNFLNLPYFNGNQTTRYAFKNDCEAATLEEFYKIFWIILLMLPLCSIAFVFDGIFKGLGWMKDLRNILLLSLIHI